jgi:hypothetical protein
MRGTFQFVDHCDGVILNRNLALTGDVYQNLIVSQAKLSRPLPWLQFRCGAQIGPFKFRFFPQLLQSICRRLRTRPYPAREIWAIDDADSRFDLQPKTLGLVPGSRLVFT